MIISEHAVHFSPSPCSSCPGGLSFGVQQAKARVANKFGPAWPLGPLQQPTFGQAALFEVQMLPRLTWVSQPGRAEAEPAEELRS